MKLTIYKLHLLHCIIRMLKMTCDKIFLTKKTCAYLSNNCALSEAKTEVEL